jgi:hypothetical protein
MWITTVLVMALAVSLEPFRVGMTVLMLNRPRPMIQLIAFLSGGFAMGMAVGLVVLFVFRSVLAESTHFTLPNVQIVIGAAALVLAALVASGVLSGPKLPTPARRLVNGHSLWTAGAAGLGIALPSVDYLAALALIVASGAAAAAQVGTLLLFNVVAFAFVELPLIAYLVAPDRTRATLSALHDWLRSRRRRDVAAFLATIGCMLLVVGLVGG